MTDQGLSSPPTPSSQTSPPNTTINNNSMNWPTNAESYSLLSSIGKGAFATVYRAQVTTTNNSNDASTSSSSSTSTPQQHCAIKILDLEHFDSNLIDIRAEVQTMRLSSHPNVIQFYTCFVHTTRLYLVTQLMSKGSSLHSLQSMRKFKHLSPQQGLNEDWITFILHETLLGLNYIHKNGQIHRDVKAGNILIDSNASVRIADFGVSGWLISTASGSLRQNTKTFVGTPCWMAPEVMEQVEGYDYKADIWSLGITALELAKGYAPYAKFPPMKVLLLTIQEPSPSLDSYDDDYIDDHYMNQQHQHQYKKQAWSKNFRDVITKCLQKDPRKRPSCEDLLKNHRHFKGFGTTGPGTDASADGTAYREMMRDKMRRELCDLIPDVGVNGNTGEVQQQRLPGSTPIFAQAGGTASEAQRPVGTSWVFSDGSQVLGSSALDSGVDKDDDKDAFFDEFENQTSGEHFNPIHKQKKAQDDAAQAEADQRAKQEKEENDDIMNEFEAISGECRR